MTRPKAPALDTVTEAISFLAAEGYEDEFGADPACGPLASATVDYVFRFEGPTDPADEAIVLGLRGRSDRKGVLVSAFGPDADPEHTALLRSLVGPTET